MTARVAALRRRSPGQVEVWPRTPRLRPYCYSCGSPVRDPATHDSTKQHRRATRAPEYRQGSGDWLRLRRFDYVRSPADEGTPAQNRAAARRLRST